MYIMSTINGILSNIDSFSLNTGIKGNEQASFKQTNDVGIVRFSFNQSEKKDNNDSSGLSERQVMQRAGNYMQMAAGKYGVSNNVKQGDNIEKALKDSKISGMCNVGSSIKIELRSIASDITNLIGQIFDKCANCKTEDEMKNAVKDIMEQLQQKKHKANVLTKRGQSAIQLNSKLSQAFCDPKKAALLEKIDIGKVVQALTKSVEDVDLGSVKGNDSLDEKAQEKAIDKLFDKALKNDEISNVVISLIKYMDKGEKDNILDDYIKDDNSQKTKNEGNNSTNPFVLNNNRRLQSQNRLFSSNV